LRLSNLQALRLFAETMTLKTKLIASTLIEVFLVALLSSMLILSNAEFRRSTAKEVQAGEIVKAITEIRFVTFEHLLHHDQRSYEQWLSRHNSLKTLLDLGPHQNAEEKTFADMIAQSSAEVGEIFNRLSASYQEEPTGSPAPLAEFQERLATQLLTKQQSQISDALRIATSAREQANELRQRQAILVSLAILLMFIISTANYFYIRRTITEALDIFHKAASRISAGDFSYRILLGNRGDEIGQLGKAFNSMAKNLAEIDKVKSEFILLASHQLRTPLTAIKWIQEELTTPLLQKNKIKQDEYIRRIGESNNRMIDLVDQLLNATKIELGKLAVEPKPTQLTNVVDQVIQDLSSAINKNRMKVHKQYKDKFGEVLIDPTWAHVIMQNLISNAVKYSPPDSEIIVRLSQHQQHIAIEVSDKGCGIPFAQQNKIFSKLFRADNAVSMVGEGSGLGLYITKAMVEQAGGSISFKSIENKGTTFYVTLPLLQ
jgi:signal transduction histidine kinase